MALSVQPVKNPTFTGIGAPPKQTITHVGVATPGSNGFASLYGPTAPSVSAAQSQGNALSSSTAALLAQIAALSRQPAQVYAPNLNFAAISAQARQQAEASVNPYYTKQLNDFLAQQGAAQSQAKVQSETNIKNLQEDLQNTLAGNAITKQRTGEDVATKLGDINTAADQFQTDSGQQFATDRIQQAKDIAKAGLTGGLGAQQEEASQAARNTTEARATAQTEEQKSAQNLFQARTFEDLSRSGTLATQSEARGEKQANVSLADFITNQGLDLQAKQGQLEAQRQADIIGRSKTQEGILVQNWINSISNPAQRDAALHAYGGLL